MCRDRIRLSGNPIGDRPISPGTLDDAGHSRKTAQHFSGGALLLSFQNTCGQIPSFISALTENRYLDWRFDEPWVGPALPAFDERGTAASNSNSSSDISSRESLSPSSVSDAPSAFPRPTTHTAPIGPSINTGEHNPTLTVSINHARALLPRRGRRPGLCCG